MTLRRSISHRHRIVELNESLSQFVFSQGQCFRANSYPGSRFENGNSVVKVSMMVWTQEQNVGTFVRTSLVKRFDVMRFDIFLTIAHLE